MRSFLRLVTKYPMATVLAVVFLSFMGIYSSRHMPVDLFPNLEIPVVNIITHSPGAAPEDMEMLVSRPIEDQMRTIPGIKRVASTSVQGLSQVTVEFTWGTTVRDARQLVQAQLARVRNVLPADVSPRIENIGTTLQEVCGYVFYGTKDLIALRNVVRHDVSGRLMSIAGVSSIEVLGGDTRAFVVTIKPETLARLRISVTDVVDALQKHNMNTVAGFVERSDREYLIRGDARLKTLQDIRSVPVLSNNEGSVLLGSIAKVYAARAPRHYVVHGNTFPAVALIVRKQPGASTIDVVRNVDRTLFRLKYLLPASVSVKKFYDQSEIVREARHEILQDLILGALLAVLVLYFFLGCLRPTLIVAFTIPLTLFATVAVMRLFAIGFNVITMTALALAIGMIVDDAIVVAENIFRYGGRTADPIAASINGASEIAGPDASGTFTTVAAFMPLVVVTGVAALFLRPFGITISAALLVSLLLSLTFVPLLFSRSAAAMVQREGFLGNRVLHFIDDMLQRILKFSFRHKRKTIVIAFVSLGAAGLVAFLGKVSLLPPIDEGALLIEYVMPPGTSLKESNRIGGFLDGIALANPDVSCVYRRTGSPESGYQIEGVNRGELFIKLKPKSKRSLSADQISASLREKFSKINGCVFLYHQPTQEKIDESFSGLPALFGITIYGTDTKKLALLAGEVETVLSSDPAISSVVNNTKVKAPEIYVRLDYGRLGMYGLDTSAVLKTLQAARIGIEVTRIVRQKEEIAVMVRMACKGTEGPEWVRKIPMVTASGGIVRLQDIASVRVCHAAAAITRLNGQREVTLVAEVKGSIPALVSRLRKKLRRITLPAGYSLEFSGQYKLIMETGLEMLLALFCAVTLIYLIMATQFGSWMQPLIILVAIPVAFVGTAIGLFITRQGLDVSVAMGAVTLAGIAVNNAIVLVDFANRELGSGVNLEKALLSAASVRLRPILLTSLTTIAALLPAAVGTTVGSQIFRPFAITVIGGLTTAVLATLIVIPTLLLLVTRPIFLANQKNCG